MHAIHPGGFPFSQFNFFTAVHSVYSHTKTNCYLVMNDAHFMDVTAQTEQIKLR